MLELHIRLRRLLQSPTYVVAVVLSLGLGTSVTLAALSIANALVFRPLPGITERRDLIRVQRATGAPLASAEFEAIATGHIQSFTALAAQGHSPLPVMLPAGPESLPVAFVSADFFVTLGTRPAAGRLLDAGDASAGAPPVALLAEPLWRRAFNGDPRAIGRALIVGGHAFTIAGVTPDGFSGLRVMDVSNRAADAPQIWMSLGEARLWPATARPQTPWLSLGGRLSAGATLRSARAELDVVARRIAFESLAGTPVDRPRSSFRIYRAGLSWRDEPSQSLLTLGLFLFIPLSVLAIGCVNVINLQLARGMDEAGEMSLRLALGASRARILWLQLPDVVCLATICAALGIAGARVLLAWTGAYLASPPALDRSVLAFTVCLVIGVVCVAGVLPAWQTSRDAVAAGLREFHDQTRRRVRLRGVLVVVQVGASVTLLALSGLAIQSLRTWTPAVAGDAHQILTADFDFTQVRPDSVRSGLFVESVLDDLGRAPSVRAAAFSTFATGGAPLRYWLDSDAPQVARVAYGGSVTPGWFAATGATFLAGSPAGRGAPRAVVVNSALAAILAGDGSGGVIGTRFRVRDQQFVVDVAGLVADTERAGDGTPLPMLFLPMPAVPAPYVFLVVHATDVNAATPAIRAAVAAADPAVPIARLEALDTRMGDLTRGLRAITSMAAAIGLVSIGLAGAGLHSLLSYTVRRRKREMGIRVALGARPNEILRLVTAPVVWLVSAGAVAGMAAAVLLATVLRSGLLGVSPLDPRGLLPGLAILLCVALIAAIGPAYHATRVDPIQCLREE
jgi:putative ABC transport system permease protein